MFTLFDDIEQLLDCLLGGGNSLPQKARFRRYVVRFVLFDTYDESYVFLERLLKLGVQHISSSKLLGYNPDYDKAETCDEISKKIKTFINDKSGEWVLTSFSDLIRFSSIEKRDTLVRELLMLEQKSNIRLIIPLVAAKCFFSNLLLSDGKSEQIVQFSQESSSRYKIYLLKDIPSKFNRNDFTVVNTFYDFLELGIKNNVKNRILTTSTALRNAYAVFNYDIDLGMEVHNSDNSYHFIKDVLGLKLGEVKYSSRQENYWSNFVNLLLTNNVNIDELVMSEFSLKKNSSFNNIFSEISKRSNDAYSLWILVVLCQFYFINISSYYLEIFRKLVHYNISSLIKVLYLTIPKNKAEANERRNGIDIMMRYDVLLSYEVEEKLEKIFQQKYNDLAISEILSIITSYSKAERRFIFSLIKTGIITINDVKSIYPNLYYYYQNLPLKCFSSQQLSWLNSYMQEYKKAKITNTYTDEIRKYISSNNCSLKDFRNWYGELSSVDKIFSERSDIEQIFWIDGLGVDWIPFINSYIQNYSKVQAYVNDVFICRSLLPSTTEKNRPYLEKIPRKLIKIGELDKAAHETHKEMYHVFDVEFKIISDALDKILQLSAGKKIAIVSDHGLSYLAHLEDGMSISNFKTEHFGRYAYACSEPTMDSNYLCLDEADGKWPICALTHRSLGSKTPSIQGAHGGCTPEEVLIPIIIISPNANSSQATARLLSTTIDASCPILKFKLEDISINDEPYIVYNNEIYQLIPDENEIGIWYTQEILLKDGIHKVYYKSKVLEQEFDINFKLGFVSDDDMFNI